MAKITPDERLIYLALKNVFKGQDALIRTSKKVRRLVQTHQNEPDVRDLIAEYNIDNVCNVAKNLLELRIFESTLEAKIRFPEVFDVSPAQSADRAASEAEAARAEADLIQDIAQGHQEVDARRLSAESETDQQHKRKANLDPELHSGAATHPSKRTPSLYPVYLPYGCQHRILTQVQGLLEQTCYSFGQERLADIISKEGWACAESVELNIWAKTLSSNQSRFDKQDIANLGKPLTEILESIVRIRHTAVHRLHVTVTRLEQHLSDAELLANLLRDDVCASRLSGIRREVSLSADELKRNKDVLELKLVDTLKKLAARRLALDRTEAAAVEDMLREDRKYQEMAGLNLERSILEPAVESNAPTEQEVGSDVDLDTGTEVVGTTSAI